MSVHRIRLILVASILVFGGIALSLWISLLQHRENLRHLRDEVRLELDQIRGDLIRELYTNTNLTQGLASLVTVQGGVSQAQFDALAGELMSHSRLIRNIALAPDNVIRFISPLEGNKPALGLKYMDNPAQRDSVLRAMAEKRIVVAGPVQLVQGGIGLIARTPIFLRDPAAGPESTSRYWGVASTVISFDGLIETTGLDRVHSHLRIALRGRDGLGGQGETFWGDGAVFDSDPVSLEIVLPWGSWQIAAVPIAGWPMHSAFKSPLFLAGLFLSLAFAMLVSQVLVVSHARGTEVRERRQTEAALERVRDELEIRVAQRTEELSAKNRELLRAKERAESADLIKSAFLATMSHELRTPLNSIIGFTGILVQGLAGPLNTEQSKQLGMVQNSARHLLALINDVLDISKIEAGQLQVKLEPIDLLLSVEKVVLAMEPMARKKGLQLGLQSDPEISLVRGDARRIEQVLMNLLSNAIKFTEHGEVMVRCSGKAGYAEVSVEDTGIGIRPEDYETLFRPFQQIDSGLTRKHEGTGLGLSICKRLLDLMGGTIHFESRPGKGSIFTVILPLAGGGD
jgi:signal transduction histidine kinase